MSGMKIVLALCSICVMLAVCQGKIDEDYDYEIRADAWCSSKSGEIFSTLSEAKHQCSDDASCAMLYDASGEHTTFSLCGKDAEVKISTIGAILHIKTISDPCFDDPCQWDGTCVPNPMTGTFHCKCRQGYDGDNCEKIQCTWAAWGEWSYEPCVKEGKEPETVTGIRHRKHVDLGNGAPCPGEAQETGTKDCPDRDEKCTYKKLKNILRDREKGKMVGFQKGSISHNQCRKLCDHNSNCQHFEYCPKRELCRLFDKTITPSNTMRQTVYFDCSTNYEWTCKNGSTYDISSTRKIHVATTIAEQAQTDD